MAASAFLAGHNLKGEIIVVDDGSTDDTAETARNVKTESGVTLHVIQNAKHRGKGYAVKTGMLKSKGRYVMFADSGNTVPYEQVLRGLELIQNKKCDIAHGSRKLPGSKIIIPQSKRRQISSGIFRWVLILYFNMPRQFTDTQCGFKIYRGNAARKLYGQCKMDGFMFDVEIILRALKSGYTIKEFPIEWTCDRDSRLSLLYSPGKVLGELIRLKRLIF